MSKIARILPFVPWLKTTTWSTFKDDLISGLTVALVLIPQSMAYAQLAGLPAHYGLYASFLPPMVAALFGSSRQLATGPVAVVSLMTSATPRAPRDRGQRGVHRVCGPPRADGRDVPVPSRRSAPRGRRQLPLAPRGQRIYQRRRHHHRHIAARQDLRGWRGKSRTPLRDSGPCRGVRSRVDPPARPWGWPCWRFPS